MASLEDREKRASLKSARNAVSAEPRLIHYDLADRYSLKALSAERQGIVLADALPPAFHACATNGFAKEASDA